MNTPPVHSKPWPWVPWALSLTGNTLLGYVGIFPLIFLITFLRGTVLMDLGWVDHPPSLRDNASIFGLYGIGPTTLILALFVAYNKLVRSKFSVPGWPYWIASSVLLVAPFILVARWPELWPHIKFY